MIPVSLFLKLMFSSIRVSQAICFREAKLLSLTWIKLNFSYGRRSKQLRFVGAISEVSIFTSLSALRAYILPSRAMNAMNWTSLSNI